MMLFLVIKNIGIAIMLPLFSAFSLAAIAWKPGVKRFGRLKMTTNDDIFAPFQERNGVKSIGCGVLGVEK